MVTFALPTCDTYSGDFVAAPAQDPDAALMLSSRGQGDGAFAVLFGRHAPSLRGFFQRQGAVSDADDLVQETFLRLYRYRDRYQDSGRFSSFLLTLARHSWTDHWRKTARRERAMAAYQAESRVQEDAAWEDHEPAIDFKAALACLSDKHRVVIELCFFQGLQLQEAADRLRIPLGTVKSRMNHALRSLRQLMPVCLGAAG